LTNLLIFFLKFLTKSPAEPVSQTRAIRSMLQTLHKCLIYQSHGLHFYTKLQVNNIVYAFRDI